jgi:molecular chaperone DnaK (HSP70)
VDKLQLDTQHTGEAAKIFRELSTSRQTERKEPVEIVADYLTQVKAHLIKNLDQKYGKALWRSLAVTLVVTVPAVWSDLAKDRTLQAIEKAGFNKLELPQLTQQPVLITEPEAAALYTIKTLRLSAQGSQFAVNDGFIMCDMGGGTVDLISYKVNKIAPVAVEELTIGCGDQCGGSFVDRAFLKWLEMKLGTADFLKISDSRSENMPRTSLSKKLGRMLQDFTLEVKSGFSGTETSYIRLPNPLSAIDLDEDKGIREGEIQITP